MCCICRASVAIVHATCLSFIIEHNKVSFHVVPASAVISLKVQVSMQSLWNFQQQRFLDYIQLKNTAFHLLASY